MVNTRGQEMPTSLFMVFVEPPTKSPALKKRAHQPIMDVKAERELPDFITKKCTSSALVNRPLLYQLKYMKYLMKIM